MVGGIVIIKSEKGEPINGHNKELGTMCKR